MTIANKADFSVTLDGRDLTHAMRPRLVSLSISEKRGDEADQLDIVLDDSDGGMALPKPGAVLNVMLGWLRGDDVTPGLVDKGSFLVDEVEHSGPPDIITIRARAADFTGELRVRRAHSWHDTTLGAIVSEVAGRNKLQVRCAPALASIAIVSAAQSRESDLAFLRRLGRENDAVATIKRGTLILSPVGAGVTPSGRALPTLIIRRTDGGSHSFRVEKREDAEGITATYHDRREAKHKTVTEGKAEGARKLSRVYANEADATRAARAARARAMRQPVSLSLNLSLGRPDIYPEQKANARGFKSEIDAVSWLVGEATHSFDGSALLTKLKLESAPEGGGR